MKHLHFQLQATEDTKTAYPSKHAAQQAAEIAMLQHPRLELFVYQPEFSKKWYLTSRDPES